MDGLATPSSDSSQSRRGSHIDTRLNGTPAHPKHIEPRRESAQPPLQNAPNGDAWAIHKTTVEAAKDEDQVNEASPLLPPRTSEDFEPLPPLESVLSPTSTENEWVTETSTNEGERQETKSSWYLFLLTLSIGGLQIAWSVELSNGSPYLLSLGISKSLLAFVWIAGPLSGTLVQPYVGIKSDRCRSRFGKRRPFMVGGAIATVASLMILAWTQEIVSGLLHGIFGASTDGAGVKVTTIVLAVIMIYVLDFAINVIQAGIRAFIVDNAPTHQQDSANAWASRISGVGNIIGYLFGYVDLPRYMWFFGDTQFKVLCVIASLAMLITLAISCFAISERDPRLEGQPKEQEGGVLAIFKDLYRSVRKLPKQIKAVCMVQFFAWIGWFPFLFYITTYIGEIYVQPFFAAQPNLSEDEIDAVWQRATRVGTFALFMFAIVTFIASVMLPWVVASSFKAPQVAVRTPMVESPTASRSLTADYFGSAGLPRVPSKSSGPFGKILARIPSLEIEWLTLRRAWLLSHLFFTLLMLLTFAVRTTAAATVLVAFIGIPWAMTNWAPFALIAAEISKRESVRRGSMHRPHIQDAEISTENVEDADGSDQAGVVLGIHNVAIAAPQVIATLVSSAIFKALQKPRGSVGDESVAWVLRFGGCCAVIAAWFCRRVGEERGR